MKRGWIAAWLAIMATGCEEASTPPPREPTSQSAASEPAGKAPATKAAAVDASPPPSGPTSPSPSVLATSPPLAVPPSPAPPSEVAPTTPAGPRWLLSCKVQGEPWTLTAELRPGDRVLAFDLADKAGRSRTWSKPEALVLHSDLPEHVLAIHSPRSGTPAVEHVEFRALPKTFRLNGKAAKTRAMLTVQRLDDPAVSDLLELSCLARQREGS